jgi:hypothetical protein
MRSGAGYNIGEWRMRRHRLCVFIGYAIRRGCDMWFDRRWDPLSSAYAACVMWTFDRRARALLTYQEACRIWILADCTCHIVAIWRVQ